MSAMSANWKLSARGWLGRTKAEVRIEEGASHTESAWAARFPEALEFFIHRERKERVDSRGGRRYAIARSRWFIIIGFYSES